MPRTWISTHSLRNAQSRPQPNGYTSTRAPHYRLARIEERTGCNLRTLADLLDLLIAVQAARGAPQARAG
jgi:hypothetical protein